MPSPKERLQEALAKAIQAGHSEQAAAIQDGIVEITHLEEDLLKARTELKSRDMTH